MGKDTIELTFKGTKLILEYLNTARSVRNRGVADRKDNSCAHSNNVVQLGHPEKERPVMSCA